MRIKAKVGNTKTLRAAATGKLRLPPWHSMKGNEGATEKSPVQLISGTEDIRLTVDAGGRKIEAKLVSMRNKAEVKGHIICTTRTVFLHNTAHLCGLHCVIVADDRGLSAEWFVRFIKVEVRPDELFAKEPGDYELDNSEDFKTRITLSGT